MCVPLTSSCEVVQELCAPSLSIGCATSTPNPMTKASSWRNHALTSGTAISEGERAVRHPSDDGVDPHEGSRSPLRTARHDPLRTSALHDLASTAVVHSPAGDGKAYVVGIGCLLVSGVGSGQSKGAVAGDEHFTGEPVGLGFLVTAEPTFPLIGQ